jgi:predicted amidohydrolase
MVLTISFSLGKSGAVIATCEESETIVYADVDPAQVETIRSSIPLYTQRRFDIYDDVSESVVFDNEGNGIKK